jgi:hypothetical protein
MLFEKEVIAPGAYWYIDETTGLPRKLDVTPELCRYWHEQGGKMLSAGLTIPVPYEHDFAAHPMTPKEKLLNNAGQIAEYRMKGDALWSVVDVQDEDVKKKIGKSVRFTSPWITSFTDGSGARWNNVIAHLALTTRPRITKQAPFQSVTAALSMAAPWQKTDDHEKGYCLSRAGRLVTRKSTNQLRPQFPIAFSMFSGGVKLAADDDMAPVKDDGSDDTDGEADKADMGSMMQPMAAKTGDVKMEELLCDLLGALGVQMPENCGEGEFKRALYEAVMSKVKDLASQGQAAGGAAAGATAANTTSPAGAGAGGNPMMQQEQQPMYMSLEEINKIPDQTMKTIALSMYNENIKLRAEMDVAKKISDSLKDARLKEAADKRAQRVALLGKVSPKAKADLDAWLALPSAALSLGEKGEIIDPMGATLALLEKSLADLPRLLTTDSAALAVQPQPTDADQLSQAEADKIADDLARMMGAAPEKKAS